MANLLVDIGNTAVKAAWADGMTLGRSFRYQGEKSVDFILSLTSKKKPEVMVISSVYEISPSDGQRFKNECTTLVILDSAHPSFLRENGLPDYITYDRAASIMAARYLFKRRGCTVVDLGTTLTVDFTDSEGRYIGGNISLGCRTRIKALNRYSRALPRINMPQEVETVGNTLESSMASGVVSGIVFELSGYFGLYPESIIVFTGGDANYFAKRIKNSIFVVCNLVLIGLAQIADRYVKKNV